MMTIKNSGRPVASDQSTGLMIYFKNPNRIHVNRFKAYTQVLSHKLIDSWQVTNDIRQAHVVATYVKDAAKQQAAKIKLSLLSRTNKKTTVFDTIQSGLKENQLIKHLNQASRKIKLANFDNTAVNHTPTQSIKVTGYTDHSLIQLCQQLNNMKGGNSFAAVSDLLSDQSVIFIEHLMLLVEPGVDDSVNNFFQLNEAIKTDQLTINHMTVVILKNHNDPQCEHVFDAIYAQCNDSTQVTILDISNEQELNNFAKFF